jgi:hypothetical protein
MITKRNNELCLSRCGREEVSFKYIRKGCAQEEEQQPQQGEEEDMGIMEGGGKVHRQ